jgi:hypothetical protein
MLWSTDFPFLALTLFVGAAIPGSLYTPAIYGMFGLTPLMVMLAIVRSCFQMAGAFADWVMRSLSTPVTRALVISAQEELTQKYPKTLASARLKVYCCLHCFFPWFQLPRLLWLGCYAAKMDVTHNHSEELTGAGCSKRCLCWCFIKPISTRLMPHNIPEPGRRQKVVHKRLPLAVQVRAVVM